MKRRPRRIHRPLKVAKHLETYSIGVDPILSEVGFNSVAALVSFHSKLF